MYLASNVKYLRIKKGMTQIDLAQELNKTSAAVSDYEKGKSVPSLEVAYQICRIFDVHIDDLVRKDMRTADILSREGFSDYSYQYKYEHIQKQLQTQGRLNQLLEQRLAELEREIREQAPALANRLGLEEKEEEEEED